MLLRGALTCAVLFFLASAPVPAARPPLEYSLAPVFVGGALSGVDVTVRFSMSGAGREYIVTPTEWGGATNLDRNIENLAADLPATLAPDPKDAGVRILTAPPWSAVALHYRVEQRWPGTLTNPDYYKPVFSPDYFYSTGAGFWVYPSGRSHYVRVSWKAVPPGNYGTCLGLNRQSAAATLNDAQLQNCELFGGDFRIQTSSVAGHGISTVVRGQWSADDTQILSFVTRIVADERRFWNDYAFSNFFVTVFPTQEQLGSSGGTSLTNSFAMFFPPGTPFGDDIRHLVAHEQFHTWLPGKLFELMEPEANEYWFSEGFTDYYSYKVLAATGLLSPSHYAAGLNKRIAAYYLSPYRNLTNAQLAKQFFDEPVGEIDYRRGELLAYRWNQQLREMNRAKLDLDTVMRSMLHRNGPLPVVDTAGIVKRFAPYLGAQAAADVRRYIARGETLVPPAALFEPCATLGWETRYLFDAGFDFVKSGRSGALTGVDPNGPAYRAGLRDGQRFTREGILRGDVEHPVKVTLTDPPARTIVFLPRGKAVAVPQYLLPAPAASFDACMAGRL